jgi:hypothetical protein
MGVSMTAQGIAIDLQAVTDLFGKLSTDVDAGFAPDGERAAQGVGCGARFGAGFARVEAVGQVKAGAESFNGASGRYVDNVRQHLSNARGLLATVEKILERYRTVDGVAAALASSAMVRSGEYADESTSANATTVHGGIATTLTQPPLPRVPEFPTSDIAWGTAYDVQRMKDILFSDNLDEAWNQVTALRLLGQTLENHYRRILELRPKLAEAWPANGSVTAQQAQTQLDEHARAVWQDAACAQTTAKSLDGIVSAISQARRKMAPLYERWQNVTTDFVPEYFDQAAHELNMQGREVMVELDGTVADLRTQIYWPDTVGRTDIAQSWTVIEPSGSSADSSASSTSATARDGGGTTDSSRRSSIPSVPGANPVDGPVLSGGIAPVGITPGTPPSTLPIPPGVLPGAPYGGAWVLPGPMTGSTGRLLPMARPATVGMTPASGALSAAARVGATGAAGTSGMMGMPMGGYAGGAGGGGAANRQRMATEQWEVAHGVPPVIGEIPVVEEEEREEEAVNAAQEEFEEWYRRIATPWEDMVTR